LTAVALTAIPAGRHLTAMAAYFATINAASVVGVLKGTAGRVSGTWATPRQASLRKSVGPLVPVGALLQIVPVLSLGAAVAFYRSAPLDRIAAFVFWASIAVLGYIYAGYPALLAIIRRVAGRRVHRAPIEPDVCVFIAANDEAAVIASKLQNTLALDYPADRLEVVVASDGSVDGTNEIVRKFAPRVRLLEFSPRRGKIAAINDGIAQVRSEIVVFSDANTFLQPDAVRALVRNFADPEVG